MNFVGKEIIYLTPVKTQFLQCNLTQDLLLFYHSYQIKNNKYMVAISMQCPFGAGKSVQIQCKPGCIFL